MTPPRLGLMLLLGSVWLACELPERADFLVGRRCTPTAPTDCDPEQACLPHAFDEARAMDFRCRDAASFGGRDGREAPVAFCDPGLGWTCPPGLVCAGGRIRADAGLRRPECRGADDPFGPPLEEPGDGGEED